jgi:integral membrane protein (TIGR01906 family)
MSNRTTKVLKFFFTLLIPVLIITAAVRLLATDQYLAYEYGKSTFPPDSFGFTSQQRFILASTNVHYVRAHLPQDELAKQTLYGVPVYNAREVSHMADVRSVFQFVLVTGQITFVLLVLIGLLLWRSRQHALASALQSGGLLTGELILLIGVTAIVAWQSWFNTFHLLFFKPGSWLFLYSDALIRLFPDQFWFDSALTISGLVLVGGLLATIFGWRWKISSQPSAV